MLRFPILFAVLAAAGCHWTLTDPGTDPKSYQLYFPTGIVMDPGGQYIYVSNGNADLRYGGGTLMMFDMRHFECTVAWFRETNGKVEPPAVCGLPPLADLKFSDASTPGKPMHPNAASMQADKDIVTAACQWDPFTPSIVDCDETIFAVANSTVKIGNFAGEIRLQRFSDESHRRLFVAVRGDPSITWVDVRFPGKTDPKDPTFRPADIYHPGVLQCVDNPANLQNLPGYDKARNWTTSPPGCDTSHLIQQYVCKDLPMCLAGLQNNGTTQLATEPFGIQIDQGNFPDGSSYGRLLVAHQASGQVSLIDINAARPNLLFVSNPFFQPDATGHHGAFALAQQHRHDPASDWYLTTNLFSQLATFRIAQANVILPEQQLSLQATFAFGNDVRDIQFEPSGDRAFFTVNNPPALLTLDTRTVPGPTGGLPQNIVTSEVDVCQTPSHFMVRRVLEPGADGQPPQLKTRIYVVCFLASQLMVVDPDVPVVLDTIFGGIGGPNQIALNFSSVDAAAEDQITELLPHRGYVTNFSESSIGVIDLDPGSATENRVIARLGFPPTGFNP